jgi:Na+/proline symporter
MGIGYGAQNVIISDPEKVLPFVINEMVPIGVKGFLVAGLMAAAMSTFDSTVNAGAAYWVRDIYQAYINPKASEKTLMSHSRWASVIIVIIGLVFSLFVKNINEIWGWITMSIGAGMIVPMLVRWYWWRFNGYGFAWGIASGMITAILQRIFMPEIPEYWSFTLASGVSLIGLIAGTLLTPPSSDEVLANFYKTTRPFGFWGPVRARISSTELEAIHTENRRDISAIFFAVPWQVILFMGWMMFIFRSWTQFGVLMIMLVILSVILYYKWFRHLEK